MHHLRIQPSEVESLPYYEYFYTVKELSNMLKEQQKGQQKQEESQNEQMANMKSQMPKMPTQSSFKTPSIKMPKF
jgi:hypothetical protein